mmetsp:Transcript_7210/g.15013  ORF Transcript_7210/g.15013 Transcript_7210/m.15013 type:complete len:312 (+) Transcript_7210:333-1268(+)
MEWRVAVGVLLVDADAVFEQQLRDAPVVVLACDVQQGVAVLISGKENLHLLLDERLHRIVAVVTHKREDHGIVALEIGELVVLLDVAILVDAWRLGGNHEVGPARARDKGGVRILGVAGIRQRILPGGIVIRVDEQAHIAIAPHLLLCEGVHVVLRTGLPATALANDVSACPGGSSSAHQGPRQGRPALLIRRLRKRRRVRSHDRWAPSERLGHPRVAQVHPCPARPRALGGAGAEALQGLRRGGAGAATQAHGDLVGEVVDKPIIGEQLVHLAPLAALLHEATHALLVYSKQGLPVAETHGRRPCHCQSV